VENSTLAEYADDVVRAVRWLRDREDVDDNRIAVVGYGDAGPVAMLAAERESRIKALALVAAPGRSGREVTLEQQAQVLSRLAISDVDRANRIAMQQRLIDAVITGKGWEAVPPELRSDAGSPWFRSWLLFDPAAIMRRLKQPVLIMQGALDAETPAAHADALEAMSSQRNKIAPTHTRKVIVPGINHLLVPARTGTVDEYPALETLTVAPAVKAALTEWLATAVPASR
jgi:pimeloyl-ACP methyl ester carboxylesterase